LQVVHFRLFIQIANIAGFNKIIAPSHLFYLVQGIAYILLSLVLPQFYSIPYPRHLYEDDAEYRQGYQKYYDRKYSFHVIAKLNANRGIAVSFLWFNANLTPDATLSMAENTIVFSFYN
jgi:hypothetical protein